MFCAITTADVVCRTFGKSGGEWDGGGGGGGDGGVACGCGGGVPSFYSTSYSVSAILSRSTSVYRKTGSQSTYTYSNRDTTRNGPRVQVENNTVCQCVQKQTGSFVLVLVMFIQFMHSLASPWQHSIPAATSARLTNQRVRDPEDTDTLLLPYCYHHHRHRHHRHHHLYHHRHHQIPCEIMLRC